MGKLQDANSAAVLSAGQSPAWTAQSSTGYPSASTDGVNVSGSLRSLIEVETSLTVGKRSALLIPVVFDTATTYNVIVDGTTVGVSGGAGSTLDSVMVALASAINASAVNGVVVATAVDSSLVANAGANTRILIEGLSDVPYSFDFSVAGGTGTSSGKADPVSSDVTIYALAGGTNPSGKWTAINSFASLTIGPDGMLERLDTAGLARLAVRHKSTGHVNDGVSVAYVVTTYIGPTL